MDLIFGIICDLRKYIGTVPGLACVGRASVGKRGKCVGDREQTLERHTDLFCRVLRDVDLICGRTFLELGL